MVIFGRRCVALWLVPILLLILSVATARTQSVPPFAGQRPILAGPPAQLLTPSNRFGGPGNAYGSLGSDFIPLSSEMLRGILPRIPNLEVGFLYNFGTNVRSGRVYADYLYPFSLSADSVLYGEAHYENQDFWKTPPGGSQYRQDLSLGGGFRRVLADRSFLGINAFYDTSKLYGKWYSSGGAGLEMVALTPGDGAIDLNFNWYGNLLNRSELINAFRNKSGSWDIEAGISQPLFNQSLDLRLSGTGYDFNIGTAVYGWRTGAELTTRNGSFSLKYEYGHDQVNGSYNTVGAYVNVGFQLENIVRGESPFTSPEPVFGSPRNLRRLLSRKVRRNWHQPAAVVLARGGGYGEIIRTIGAFQLLYNSQLGIWEPTVNFPWRSFEPSVPYTDLDPNGTITVEFDYSFSRPQNITRWNLHVAGTAPIWAWNGNGWMHWVETTGDSGHVVVELVYDMHPQPYQMAFTSASVTPNLLGMQAWADWWMPDMTLTITNLVIRFNQ